MASYSPLGVPFQLKPTIADFGESFNKGLQYGMEPRKQAESLLSTLLANKQNAVKAKYAEQMEQANLGHIGAQTKSLLENLGLIPLHKQQLEGQINKERMEYDPEYRAAYYNKLRQALSSQVPGQTTGQPTGQPSGYDQALMNQAYGLPAGYQSPEQQAARELQNKKAQQEQTIQIKEAEALENDIPKALDMMERINKGHKTAIAHPEWFGPGTGGLENFPVDLPWFGLHKGSKARARDINSPEYGTLESLFGSMQGEEAANLSHGNRVLATAFNLAGNIKPGFHKTHGVSLGNMQQVKETLYDSIERSIKRANKLAGYQKYQNPYVWVKSPKGTKVLLTKEEAEKAVKAGGRYA